MELAISFGDLLCLARGLPLPALSVTALAAAGPRGLLITVAYRPEGWIERLVAPSVFTLEIEFEPTAKTAGEWGVYVRQVTAPGLYGTVIGKMKDLRQTALQAIPALPWLKVDPAHGDLCLSLAILWPPLATMRITACQVSNEGLALTATWATSN